MAQITIITNNSKKTIDIPEGADIEFGREPSTENSVIIHDPSVSRSHAILSLRQGKFYITDLGSTNGTWLGDRRLNPKETALLNHAVVLGKGKIMLEVAGNQHQSSSAGNIEYGKSGPKKSSSGKSLESLLEQHAEVVIGRSSECQVVLNDPGVSRKHTRIFKAKDGIYAEDLGSLNGTFINGKRLKGKQKLRQEDTLYVGLNAFKLGKAHIDLSTESAINAIEVSKVYRNGHVGLHPMSISIPDRQMVAMMGPSGCGKSTLLKILNGDNPATGGQVYIFGLELLSNYELLKQKIGYVPQDDIVHPELSVNDTLYYAAKLRLGGDTPDAEIADRMNEVLTSLNINDEKIRNREVGRLSGGQRKRVSIAVELLNKPKILFLDEPTSPLDPETIEEFLKCLRQLCNQGTTVVMVTHKPEDLNYVDRLIFMGSAGYHVYDGNNKAFLQHFGSSNIVEVYSLLNNESSSKNWYLKWYKQDRSPDITRNNGVKKDAAVNAASQLYWLMRRYLHIKMSNGRNMMLLVFQPILIAILIILVFEFLLKNSREASSGVLFMMAVAAVWFGVSNSAREIVGEKAIFRRERMFNLLLGPYLLSKWIILSLISLFQILIFIAILKIGYQEELKYILSTTFFLVGISASAILFGLVLSSLSGTAEEVMSILPVALMPQILLAGMINPLNNAFTEFLSYFTLGRWGTEGLARIQDNFDSKGPFTAMINNRLYQDPDLIKAFDSFEKNMLALGCLDMAMLIALVSFILLSERKLS